MKSINIFSVDLPMKRPFQWRVFGVLVVLYFLGNLAGIPLLRKTNMPVEPVRQWGVLTLISALIIALSLFLANRTGLGAPLLEGRLSKEGFTKWLRTGFVLTTLMLAVGMPLSLITNLGADPATYPFGWELLPAAFKAGVVEEIFSRLFLVSLFAWVGQFFKRDLDGRPTRAVFWMAILLVGMLFGWGHVETRLGIPTATFWDYALIMVLNSGLGIYFGWLFWKLGLEWAMFAHFMYDAFVSIVVIPVYLLKNPIAWIILLTGLAIVSIMSVLFLMKIDKLLMVFLGIVLVSCAPLSTVTSTETPMPTTTLASIPPTNSVVPSSTSEQLSPAFDLSKFAFPTSVDTTKQYLFYLHGRIIEEQGIPAVDPVFGEYEYQSILEKLSSYGFVVISEQRVKNTNSIEYAKRIQEQVTTLLNAGVPATNISVVGASKGAYITIYVSHFLENQEIKFVIMGICNAELVTDFKQNHIFLYGKVLSIYDSADYQYGGSCEELFTLSEGNEGLSRHNEIVLNIGTGHGILYKPLDEWITPVIQWARSP